VPDDSGGSGNCCGEVKYICALVDQEYETCCMPAWANGCTYDNHCCPIEGVDTFCVDSVCVIDGTDAPTEDRVSRVICLLCVACFRR